MLKRSMLLAAVSAASVLALSTSAGFAKDSLRMTVAYYSAATEPYFKSQARAFEAGHPAVDVQVEVVNWDSLQQKLTTDIAGGVNADIALIGTRWQVDYVQQDLAEPLDGYADAAFRDRFIGAFLSPGEIGGKLYGLPIAASARAMFYNKDLFDKAGITQPPRTWDDVVAAARKLKAAGAYGYGMQGKEIDTDVYFYLPFWTYGGDLLGKNGKPAFDSPAGVKAATLYKSIVDDGLSEPGVTGYNREDVQNLFKQGRLGMVLSLPFLSGQIKKEAPGLHYGITPIPAGTTPATYAVTDSVVMFKNSTHKKLAWEFLDQIFSAKPRIEFTAAEGFLPTTKAEADDPHFKDDPDLKVFVDLLPTAKFAPQIPNWEGVSAAVIRNLQALYLDKKTPDQAMRDATAEAAAALSN